MTSVQERTRATDLRLAFCLIAWTAAVSATVLSFHSSRQTTLLDPATVVVAEGYSFSYPLPPGLMPVFIFGRQADHNDEPKASNLVLMEDGNPVGVPHSLHNEIRTVGEGRFSHWKVGGLWSSTDFLIFSTSDNSDPRANGRTYSVEYAPKPGWITLYLIAGFCVISILGLYRTACNDSGPRATKARKMIAGSAHFVANGPIWTVLVLGAAAYVVYYYAAQMPAVPLLTLDSRKYLMGSTLLPLGYWCYANLVSLIGDNLSVLPAAQISTWAASILALYFALYRLMRFRFVAALVSVSLLLLGTVTKFVMLALTETIFASVLIFHVVAVMFALHSPTKGRLFIVGITAFFAAFIRPAGYFVALCTLALFFMLPRSRRAILVCSMLPMIALYLLAGYTSYIYRGVATHSLLGLALFPHVAHLFKAEFAPEIPLIAKAVDRSFAAYRAELSTKVNWRDRVRFEMENFNRVSIATQVALGNFGARTPEELNGYFRAFAFATIRRNPLDYATHVIEHVTFAWRDLLFYRIDTSNWLCEHYKAGEENHNTAVRTISKHFSVPQYRFNELTTSTRSLAYGSAAVDYVPNLLSSIPSLGLITGSLSAIFSIVSLFCVRASPRLKAVCYISALMHSAVFLVAGTTTVIPRYMDPLVPLAIILLGLSADEVLAGLWRRAKTWLTGPADLAVVRGS